MVRQVVYYNEYAIPLIDLTTSVGCLYENGACVHAVLVLGLRSLASYFVRLTNHVSPCLGIIFS